ncbi:1-pyrroline-5-carboxylate dehydrogenase, partial [Aeromicrobium sp. CnD17-E]|nr:1-pyrroline-5-carboxylate dehydrogenase [Aeromicrobium sp. CnD17-E]
ASRDVFAASDVSALMAERNVFRYLPATVHVRLAEAGDPADLLRTVAAALAADADLTVSSAVDLPALASVGVEVVVEDDAAWAAGLPNAGHQRIRLVGAPASVVAQALDGRPDVAVFDHPVVESGRVERLPYVLEQAVSITAHRFGTPDHLTDEVLVTG